MGSPSIPAAPPAPDYAEANREAIYTDVETLPLRRQIEQAARLGEIVNYIDPATGERRTADFTGLGDIASGKQAAQLLSQVNADMQRQQLALRQELGVANAQQTAAEVAAADPQAYATRQRLTEQVLGQLNGPGSAVQANQNIYDVATRLGQIDPSTNALNAGLQQALADFQLGGQLDPQTSRLLTDQVRSGQAARGNFLGDAAAVMEAGTMGQAAEQRRSQRLGQLLGIQSQAFGQNQTLNQNALAGAQALAGEQRTTRNENYARDQQGLANASAMVLGQPITNQFGSLQGAQQGAVAFTPIGGGGLPGLNANAGAQGAQWAQQNYGNAMNGWQTQANIAAQGNPWMGLLGSAAGAATGAGAAALIGLI